MKMNIQFFADELIGTWTFNDTISNPNTTFDISFTSDSTNFIRIYVVEEKETWLKYNNKLDGYSGNYVYSFTSNSWYTNLKTIKITDTSSLTNREEFVTWFSANSNFKPKPKGKDVKLKDGDIQLFPQTKASLLVNDDGTPYTPTLPQATTNTLGGVKAKPSTTEDTQEVHINSSGELVTKASSGGGGGTQLYKHVFTSGNATLTFISPDNTPTNLTYILTNISYISAFVKVDSNRENCLFLGFGKSSFVTIPVKYLDDDTNVVVKTIDFNPTTDGDVTPL